jgi:hypothetical protein
MSTTVVQKFINEIKSISGFVAVAICEIESGLNYGSHTVKADFDPELASAFNLEVVKAKFNAIKALGLKEDIEDIMITLSSQLHILSVSKNKQYMVYLAVDKANANLGLTRGVLRKLSVDLEKGLA